MVDYGPVATPTVIEPPPGVGSAQTAPPGGPAQTTTGITGVVVTGATPLATDIPGPGWISDLRALLSPKLLIDRLAALFGGKRFGSDYFVVRPENKDGYLTLGEAKWQWQNGGGASLTVDANKLDFSGLHVSNFPQGPGSTQLYTFQNAPDFLVYGTVTARLNPNSTIEVRPDTYNFDIKPGWSFQALGRNFETVVSHYIVHGPGVPFKIFFDGTVPILP